MSTVSAVLTARALRRGERRQLVERAALLEGIGDLQILVFDVNLRSGQSGER